MTPADRFRLERVLVAVATVALWLCAAHAGAGLNRWTTKGPDLAGISTLAVDPTNPSIVYAGTSAAGVLRSEDGGATWESAWSGMTEPSVLSLAVDPVAPSTVYAGTQSSFVARSSDGGRSWISLYAYDPAGGTNFQSVQALAIDPLSATVYAATNAGLVKSGDGGCHWETAGDALLGVALDAIAIDPADPSVLYAGSVFAGAFRSADGGATWTAISAGLTNHEVRAFAFDYTGPAAVYAATVRFVETTGETFGMVFKSYDAGATWFPLDFGLPDAPYVALWADPSNSVVVYAASLGAGVFRTANAGVTWTSRNIGLPNELTAALTGRPGAAVLYAGSLGRGTFRTEDGGLSWLPSSGERAFLARAVAADPQQVATVLTGGGAAGVIAKTTDSGQTWTPTGSGLPADRGVVAFGYDPTDSATVYTGTFNFGGVFKSIDGGATWTPTPPLSPAGTSPDPAALIVDPFVPQTVYAATGGGLFRSDDAGTSWTQPDPAASGANALVADVAVAGRLLSFQAAYADSGLRVSTDRGASWNPSNTGIENLFISSLAQDPSNTMRWLAAGEAAPFAGLPGIYESTDGGASWIPVASVAPDSPNVNALAFDPLDPTRVWASANPTYPPGPHPSIVLRSVDGGANWEPFAFGLPSTTAYGIAVEHSGTVHLATGAGVWELEPSDVDPPRIDSVAPLSGPAAGGTALDIFGAGFDPAALVSFAGIPATVQSADDGHIAALTSGGPAGPADLVVTNPDGQLDTLARAFVFDYADVPNGSLFHEVVVTVSVAGVSSGCGGDSFCVFAPLSRGQAAVQIERALHGPDFVYPVPFEYFSDVPRCSSFLPYISQFVTDGITAGCGGLRYCPDDPITRAQAAVLWLRAEHGLGYQPPPATGTLFADVPADAFAADYIEQFAAEGATAGCGGGNYCPNASVTRGQAAAFHVRVLLAP
ncbi:MAG TPA: S-layer homology domain-containing protein [Thermoanaerobaculia bacterium]|jgi:photosystem II stability/assembly factor-like uncharacterized protein|nr:S-layer homology domain-containing protein [Thermoanaerobaculia bacterium]